MPVMLQVRNLPDEVHARLKQRAREARMSLSDYVGQELANLVLYQSNAEIFAEAQRRFADLPKPSSQEIVDMIRADRDARG